jgi:hypothetical protein
VSAQIGSAVSSGTTEAAANSVTRRHHKHRRARLSAGKPYAGRDYSAQLSFGRVPVATAALDIGCRARLAGKRLKGTGDIVGHAATCTWTIPDGARGERLVVRVKIEGRHRVSLARAARLIVG